MSSAKWWPFCLGLNVLIQLIETHVPSLNLNQDDTLRNDSHHYKPNWVKAYMQIDYKYYDKSTAQWNTWLMLN